MRLGIYRDCETGKSSPQGEDERLVSRTRGFLSEEALPADLKIMERTILLTIEYDGTGFSGWQRQPGKRTVQGELERVLSVLCAGPVQIDGTGRTDAGVHALGQCASFSGEFSIPTESIAKAANDMLAESRLRGGDIRVISAREVEPGFHARFSARGKKYVYRIRNGAQMPVFLRNYRYHVRTPLDTGAMKAALGAFEGTHDFAGFMAAGSNLRGSTVRTIWETSLKAEGGTESRDIEISVSGNGFLYNMVRIIAGTLVDVGSGRILPEMIPEIIASGDRSRAGHTAPPQGLYMAEVYFQEKSDG